MNMTLKTSVRSAFIIGALSTGLLTTPAFAADPKPASDGLVSTVKDAAITAKVKAKLMKNAELKKSDISVSTFNGVVSLSGVATTAAAKSQAESDAKSIEDVKDVNAAALSIAGK